MRVFLITLLLLISTVLNAEETVDKVVVLKLEKKLILFSGVKKVKEYSVVFGDNPKGHKQQEGDERTPEGNYILDYKNSNSSFYKSIHISYPNEEDKKRAKDRGVSPDGDIMIHGQKNGWGWLSPVMQFFNWTDGCIAITNSEMDELWIIIKVGTPIEIKQ